MIVIQRPVLVFGLCMIFTAFVAVFEWFATKDKQHVKEYIKFYSVSSLGVIFLFQLVYLIFPALTTLSGNEKKGL
ncbi:hypothetical protein CN918_25655 [Priestia megaterium]|nr:hypothetical protein CN918_25655 [Priestia megaterium]